MTKRPVVMRNRWEKCKSSKILSCKEARGYCTIVKENRCCKDCNSKHCESRCEEEE